MKSLCLVLLLALSTTPACSHSTTTRRQERAYAKYLKKMHGEGARHQARLSHNAPQMPPPEAMAPSEPRETTQLSEDGPQTVPSDSDNH